MLSPSSFDATNNIEVDSSLGELPVTDCGSHPHRLLVVDSRVEDTAVLINSAQNNVHCIIVDFANDTFDGVLAKIRDTACHRYVSAGWVSHSYSGESTQFLGTQQKQMVVENVVETDSDIGSWSELMAFFSTLHMEYGVECVHMISCDLGCKSEYVYAFGKLEQQIGVRFHLAEGKVGNAEMGGSWTIDGVSMIDEGYFTKDVEQYGHVLADYDNTALTFTNNVITISNEIINTDTDVVTFDLNNREQMLSLIVINVSGSGDISYNISPGDISGTFIKSSIGHNLLSKKGLTPSTATSYTLTLTTGSTTTMTYSLKGTNKAYKIMLNPGLNEALGFRYFVPTRNNRNKCVVVHDTAVTTPTRTHGSTYWQVIKHNITDVASLNAALEKHFSGMEGGYGYRLKPKIKGLGLPYIYYYGLADNYDGTASVLLNAIPTTETEVPALYPEYVRSFVQRNQNYNSSFHYFGGVTDANGQWSQLTDNNVPTLSYGDLPSLLNFSSTPDTDTTFNYNSSTETLSGSNVISSQFSTDQLSNYYRFDDSGNIYMSGTVSSSNTEHISFDLDEGYDMVKLTIADMSQSGTIQYSIQSLELTYAVSGTIAYSDVGNHFDNISFTSGRYDISMSTTSTTPLSYSFTGTKQVNYTTTNMSNTTFNRVNIDAPSGSSLYELASVVSNIYVYVNGNVYYGNSNGGTIKSNGKNDKRLELDESYNIYDVEAIIVKLGSISNYWSRIDSAYMRLYNENNAFVWGSEPNPNLLRYGSTSYLRVNGPKFSSAQHTTTWDIRIMMS